MSIVIKLIGDKKRYRAFRARIKALPAPYRATAEAIADYWWNFAGSSGDSLMGLMEQMADIFEEAAADATPVSAIVGDDPVVFADDLLASYPEETWLEKMRRKLRDSVTAAEAGGRK